MQGYLSLYFEYSCDMRGALTAFVLSEFRWWQHDSPPTFLWVHPWVSPLKLLHYAGCILCLWDICFVILYDNVLFAPGPFYDLCISRLAWKNVWINARNEKKALCTWFNWRGTKLGLITFFFFFCDESDIESWSYCSSLMKLIWQREQIFKRW